MCRVGLDIDNRVITGEYFPEQTAKVFTAHLIDIQAQIGPGFIGRASMDL